MKTERIEKPYLKQSLEISIRLFLVVVLLWYCFSIVSPFISSILWGIITAVAMYPVFSYLKKKMGIKNITTAVIITVFSLLLFAIPLYFLISSLVSEINYVASGFINQDLVLPALPGGIAEWPIVGKKIDAFWSTATENMDQLLVKYETQLNTVGSWLLDTLLGLVSGVFHFVLAIIFAGIFLAYSDQSSKIAHQLFVRIAGKHGEAFCSVTEKTIMSVTKGVLGVSLIQSTMAAVGFFAVGIPGAGILTICCLVLSTVQVGLIPIVLPVIIYGFYTYSTVTAVILCIWLVIVSVTDNILKPILLGKGAPVPMPVIFIGVIGGFIAFGIVGMFIGSVIFSIGYILFLVWLNDGVEEESVGV